jgi:hypothetical protein
VEQSLISGDTGWSESYQEIFPSDDTERSACNLKKEQVGERRGAYCRRCSFRSEVVGEDFAIVDKARGVDGHYIASDP